MEAQLTMANLQECCMLTGKTCILRCPAWATSCIPSKHMCESVCILGQEQNLLGQQGHHASSSQQQFVLSDLDEM